MKKILNLAAGKMKPLGLEDLKAYFLVNLDTMYYNVSDPEMIERHYVKWRTNVSKKLTLYCKEDAFTFMERTKIQFDKIVCYRFLEHIKKTDVLYFIYLMSTCLEIDGELDVIVPNYRKLAKMIINEDVIIGTPKWEAHDITLTYELLNEPGCPHASIWTPERFKYFFGLEKRFIVADLKESFEYDGRDIYIRAIIKRVK